MRIVFPHIPKCCGSSIAQQLHALPDAHFDYVLHPTWQSTMDRDAGALERNNILETLKRLESWVVFGHFAADAFDALEYDIKIILLRPPVERALSHYQYVKYALPDNELTRRRHKEVAKIKGGQMTFDEFTRIDHIRNFYGGYYLKNLVEDGKTLGLSALTLRETFRTIYEYCGLRLDEAIWANKGAYDSEIGDFVNRFSRDAEIYSTVVGRRPSVEIR